MRNTYKDLMFIGPLCDYSENVKTKGNTVTVQAS